MRVAATVRQNPKRISTPLRSTIDGVGPAFGRKGLAPVNANTVLDARRSLRRDLAWSAEPSQEAHCHADRFRKAPLDTSRLPTRLSRNAEARDFKVSPLIPIEASGAFRIRVASAYLGVGLISSYATGQGAVMAIEEQARVRIIVGEAQGDGDRLLAETRQVLRMCGTWRLAAHVAPLLLPMGKGLKSSSAVATAYVKATAAAVAVELADADLVDASAHVQRLCGLTTAGSLDDTWSAVAGGLVIADGVERRLLLRQAPPSGVGVVILVPSEARPAAHRMDRVAAMKPHARRVARLIERLARGDIFAAATDAAFIQSSALTYCIRPLRIALAHGAWGVTLSGKGPARVAFADGGNCARIACAWREAYPRAEVFVTRPAASVGSATEIGYAS